MATKAKVKAMACCGINELMGIANGDPKEVILTLYGQTATAKETGESRSIRNSAFAIMTEPVKGGYDIVSQQDYGAKCIQPLVKFIKKNGLGNVLKSNTRSNPVYGLGAKHGLTVYLWEIDNPALKKWVEANK